LRSAALISRGGSLDWLCWPRFDRPALFAHPRRGARGRFSSLRRAAFRSERAYLDETNVLGDALLRAGGALELIDFMPVQEEREVRRTIRPQQELVCASRAAWRARSRVEIVFESAAPDYARREARLEPLEDGACAFVFRVKACSPCAPTCPSGETGAPESACAAG